MIPSATQLIDSEGDVWTVAGGVISLNGVAQTETRKVTLLLYVGGVIYQENINCMWWRWTNNAWVATSQPAAAGIAACSSPHATTVGTPAASANGSLIPTVNKLIDSLGNVWTVSNGVISINGQVQTITQQVIVLLYFNGVIFQENSHCMWWKWINGAWVSTGQPTAAGLPGCGATTSHTSFNGSSGVGVGTIIKTPTVSSNPTASANGSMIPAVSQLVDGAGNVWSVSGGVISMNGTAQTITQQVIALVYSNGTIYQENVHCMWWSWSGGAWVSSTRPAVAGIPACPSSGSFSAASSTATPTVSSKVTAAPVSTTASTSTSSSSSSANSNTSGTIPAAAAAVGYDTNTFNSVSFNPASGPWFGFDFYGENATADAGAAAANPDGSLSVPGSLGNSGANIATAHKTSSGNHWEGTAFGGGAYFEAVISFTNQNDQNFPDGGPAFWALDVEHSSQGPYQVSWPGVPNDSSGNPYDDYFEVDFMEYDFSGGYQFGIGNWYGYPRTQSTSNPTRQNGGVAGSLLVPQGTDFSQPHRYGTLWVPATGSGQTTTTQGYLQNYFDGVPMGPKYTWDYHDPNAPGYPAPAPVVGTTAMSGMDFRHLFLILGTEPEHPMTVYSVNVWQASAANNITH
jgi:hypothetical protein